MTYAGRLCQQEIHPERVRRTGRAKAEKSLPQGESHAAPKSTYAQEAAGLLRAKSKKALKSGNSALEAYSQVSYYIDVCPDGSGSPAAGQAMKYRQYQNHI